MICKPCNIIIEGTITSSERLHGFLSQNHHQLEEEIIDTKSHFRNKIQFIVPRLSSFPDQLQKQKILLATALISRNLTFDDNLCFSNPDCPSELNHASLESYLEELGASNLKVFKEFKKLSGEGNYAPLHVINHQLQGFAVEAVDMIPKFTLILEYVGDVDFFKERLFGSNDSIIELLRTPHSSSCLVICPESKGNLARFISGINNNDSKACSKINIASIRFNIGGKARFCYTNKDIISEDTLYYDYNAGGINAYPTDHFV